MLWARNHHCIFGSNISMSQSVWLQLDIATQNDADECSTKSCWLFMQKLNFIKNHGDESFSKILASVDVFWFDLTKCYSSNVFLLDLMWTLNDDQVSALICHKATRAPRGTFSRGFLEAKKSHLSAFCSLDWSEIFAQRQRFCLLDGEDEKRPQNSGQLAIQKCANDHGKVVPVCWQWWFCTCLHRQKDNCSEIQSRWPMPQLQSRRCLCGDWTKQQPTKFMDPLKTGTQMLSKTWIVHSTIVCGWVWILLGGTFPMSVWCAMHSLCLDTLQQISVAGALPKVWTWTVSFISAKTLGLLESATGTQAAFRKWISCFPCRTTWQAISPAGICPVQRLSKVHLGRQTSRETQACGMCPMWWAWNCHFVAQLKDANLPTTNFSSKNPGQMCTNGTPPVSQMWSTCLQTPPILFCKSKGFAGKIASVPGMHPKWQTWRLSLTNATILLQMCLTGMPPTCRTFHMPLGTPSISQEMFPSGAHPAQCDQMLFFMERETLWWTCWRGTCPKSQLCAEHLSPWRTRQRTMGHHHCGWMGHCAGIQSPVIQKHFQHSRVNALARMPMNACMQAPEIRHWTATAFTNRCTTSWPMTMVWSRRRQPLRKANVKLSSHQSSATALAKDAVERGNVCRLQMCVRTWARAPGETNPHPAQATRTALQLLWDLKKKNWVKPMHLVLLFIRPPHCPQLWWSALCFPLPIFHFESMGFPSFWCHQRSHIMADQSVIQKNSPEKGSNVQDLLSLGWCLKDESLTRETAFHFLVHLAEETAWDSIFGKMHAPLPFSPCLPTSGEASSRNPPFFLGCPPTVSSSLVVGSFVIQECSFMVPMWIVSTAPCN